MKKFFDSNLFYGIVALAMAIFLLFYVQSSENPVDFKTFKNVNVAVNNLPENYQLDVMPGSVEIEVSGLVSTLNLSSVRDIKAFVDLRGVKPGTEAHPIQYVLPNGLSLIRMNPESVELSVDALGAKELQVSCHLYNTVRQGFSSTSPVVRPSAVTVAGPQRLLDQIQEARVSVDLNDRIANYNANQHVVLLDKDGHEFQSSRISLSEDTVNVHVEIAESLSSKSVSVHALISAPVDSRYNMTSIEVQPSSVKITGTYATVSTIEFLTTEPIDLSAMTETFQGLVWLMTPPGVDVLEGNQVELTIRIEKNLTKRTVDHVPVSIRNAPEDKNYGTLPLTVSVTLAAFPDVFEADMAGGELSVDIIAYIDLAGEEADTRDYPLIVELPERYELSLISESTVRVYAKE